MNMLYFCGAMVLLFSISLGEQVPSKIIPDLSKFDDAGGESMMGGYALQMHCPEGIEDFEWKDKEFTLHFSMRILEGKVNSVSRTFREDKPEEWVRRFEESCIQALKQWRFSKAWTKKGVLKDWGMTLHITFQSNKFGDCNININQGAARVYMITNPLFSKDET